MVRFSLARLSAIVIIVALPIAVFADPVERARGGGSSVEWRLNTHGHAQIDVTVSTPGGDVLSKSFKGGQNPRLGIQDLGTDVEDGVYIYELRVVPTIPGDVAKKLEKARAANDDAAAKKILKAAGISEYVLTGAVTVQGGRFVDTEGKEEGDDPASSLREQGAPAPGGSTPTGPGKVAVQDQVIPDDLIVQGSTCVGFDCVNNESFGFDTIRLKENSTRIKAEDTSVSPYPTNDWQITFNDSASGGASKFSVEDITGAKVPMTITAGATTNSIFVDSTGRVGFRTATPVLDLHVNTSNTPALRLEQNNSGGFTAQTWDVAGNEANFFVRDVTGGSLLSFRIRPGAPTSSIDISSSGAVGIAGASPANPITNGNYISKLQLLGGDELGNFLRIYNTNSTWEMGGVWQPNTARTAGWLFGTNNTGAATLTYGSGATEGNALSDAKDTGDGISVLTSGDVGIRCNNPTSDFVIATTANCTGSLSSINAGSTQFTVTSSRAIKENLEPVAVPNLLDRIANVDVYTYDFKQGPKGRLGLMAEDFHEVFGRGNETTIDGNEVQMALWLAVQQLTEQNKQLQERLNALEQKQP
jgi:hypothetical protein